MNRFNPLTVRCQNIARFFVNGQELWRTVMNAKIQFSEEKMQNHEFATVRKSTLRWTHNPLVVGSSPTRPTNIFTLYRFAIIDTFSAKYTASCLHINIPPPAPTKLVMPTGSLTCVMCWVCACRRTGASAEFHYIFNSNLGNKHASYRRILSDRLALQGV